jgi:hypothetical protein
VARYSEETIKILFGRATRCAYPECTKPLIFEDRGHLTVTAQIAHIRSEKPGGPRHVPGYEQFNSEENLLLLCGEHHHPVDRHESIYPIEELLQWKKLQIAQGVGRVLSDNDLTQILRYVQQSLSALIEVSLRVRPVALIHHSGIVWTRFPLRAFSTVRIQGGESERYLGVEVVNDGLASVTIGAAGFEFDLRTSANARHQVLFDDSPFYPSRRVDGRSSGAWPLKMESVRAGLGIVYQEYRLLPHRFRTYAVSATDDQVEGEWFPISDLPILGTD